MGSGICRGSVILRMPSSLLLCHGRSKIVLGIWITIRDEYCDVIMSGVPGGGM